MSIIQQIITKYPMHNLGYTMLQELQKDNINNTGVFDVGTTGSIILMREFLQDIYNNIETIEKDVLLRISYKCKNVRKHMDDIFIGRVVVSQTNAICISIEHMSLCLMDDIESTISLL